MAAPLTTPLDPALVEGVDYAYPTGADDVAVVFATFEEAERYQDQMIAEDKLAWLYNIQNGYDAAETDDDWSTDQLDDGSPAVEFPWAVVVETYSL